MTFFPFKEFSLPHFLPVADLLAGQMLQLLSHVILCLTHTQNQGFTVHQYHYPWCLISLLHLEFQ